MYSQNKKVVSSAHSNVAFEVDSDDPLALNPLNEDRPSQSIVLADEVVDNPQGSNNLPSRAHTGSSKTQLEDIPEDESSRVSGRDVSQTNTRINTSSDLHNMSISNFKKIRGQENPNRMENQGTLQGDTSRDSAIQMRTSIDQHVQTGQNFPKTSTFLIAPKTSVGDHPEYILYNTAKDCFGIKLMKNRNVPELFIEIDCLQLNPNNQTYCWIERSRWLRYEEYYNPDLKRFDSPHLSPISVRGLSMFRKLFAKGEAVLDCHKERLADVLNSVVDSITEAGTFTPAEIVEIRSALMQRHYHRGDIGSSSYHDLDKRSFQKPNEDSIYIQRTSNLKYDNKSSSTRLDARLEPGTEALSVQVGVLESLKHTFSMFVRLDPPIYAEGLNEVNCPSRFIFIVFGPKIEEDELLEVGRVFAVMMSNTEFREVCYSASRKEDLLEAAKIFTDHSVVVPLNRGITYEALGAMLPQMKVYANYFQAEQNRNTFNEIRKGMVDKGPDIVLDTYTNGVRRRVSLNPQLLSQARLSNEMATEVSTFPEITDIKQRPLRLAAQVCRPLHHFLMDWKGLGSRYPSDFRDAFKWENISTVLIGIIFIYFVVLSPAITFGALLNAVNPNMSVSLMLVASGFYQFVYTLLSGQPLEVVGITGPVFVVEKVLGILATGFNIDLEVMRFWIGVYVAMLGTIFTIFNGVIVIKHFRRSVEEVYNFLVAAIFILSAFFSMFKALPYTLTTMVANGSNIKTIDQERSKFAIGGTTLFLAFLMANFCVTLVKIKRGSFFRRQIRNLLGSFNVPLGIILIFAMDQIFFQAYHMPTLNVPPSTTVNLSLWINPPVFSNLANASGIVHSFCFLISLSLFAILFTEVSTNSIATTKTERKLVKPSLYSLNYFYVLVIFPIISAVTGWPFVSGAMVRSNAHCIAMSKWSLNLPGVPSKIIGAVEQRVSGVSVGLLVFLSVFLGSVLRFIPMASMYGMFLYMGIMGARDLVFTRRLISILQRRKYWVPDEFLKDYPTWNIGILILIQGCFIAILIALNCISEFTSYSWVTLIFPLFVGMYAVIRGYALPKWPRLNTHLSKMDKKHPVKLYADEQAQEKVLLTVDENGVNMQVVLPNTKGALAMEDDDVSISDTESELDKYW